MTNTRHIKYFGMGDKIMNMKKILLLGQARGGKDTLAEIWRDNFGIKFESSSMASARLFIYDVLKDKYNYKSFEECFEDRVNKRKEWFELISSYNVNDLTRLARHMMLTNDIYVGMRSKEEVQACKEFKMFDLVVWVDAEERVGKESIDSCTVTKEDADLILTNNGTLKEFTEKAIFIGKSIFND